MMKPPYLVVAHTTCADAAAATRLARALVDAHLAACVSIGSEIQSIYPWRGRIESATEVALQIKASPEKLPALKEFLVENHDYDVPELLVTPVIDGYQPYLEWAREWLDHD